MAWRRSTATRYVRNDFSQATISSGGPAGASFLDPSPVEAFKMNDVNTCLRRVLKPNGPWMDRPKYGRALALISCCNLDSWSDVGPTSWEGRAPYLILGTVICVEIFHLLRIHVGYFSFECIAPLELPCRSYRHRMRCPATVSACDMAGPAGTTDIVGRPAAPGWSGWVKRQTSIFRINSEVWSQQEPYPWLLWFQSADLPLFDPKLVW